MKKGQKLRTGISRKVRTFQIKKCENSTMFGFGQVDMFLSWRDLLAQKQSPKQSITSYLADPHHTVLIIYLKIS
jgi:hypothetical protein